MPTPPPELALRRLEPGRETGFDDLLSFYDDAFPESERKPMAVLRRMLADQRYYFLLATEHEAPVGFAIMRVLRDGTAALLEYMAVASAHRGRGLGRRIAYAVIQAPQTPLAFLVEVESDRVECAERALRARRKEFYRTLGAREFQNLSWIMPSVAQTPPPPMEMMLLSQHISSIGKDQLREWLTHIYVDVYEQSSDDPRLAAMLAGLPAEVKLV